MWDHKEKSRAVLIWRQYNCSYGKSKRLLEIIAFSARLQSKKINSIPIQKQKQLENVPSKKPIKNSKNLRNIHGNKSLAKNVQELQEQNYDIFWKTFPIEKYERFVWLNIINILILSILMFTSNVITIKTPTQCFTELEEPVLKFI